jgi:gliding motility-associated-like protein
VTVVVSKPMRIHTIPFDTIAYPGSVIPLRANSDSGIIYSWSPSLGLSNPNIPDPIATVGNIGEDLTYQVVVTSAAGCVGEGYVRIRIYKGPEIYVPTAFTPNGDGKNDRLTPFPVGINELKAFRVFNRWGNEIFSTRRLHDGWDGRLQGREQPAGIYVWVVEAVTSAGKLIEKKGTVTLIR